MLPLEVDANVLTVAVADPTDTGYKDPLRQLTRLAITEAVATPQELSRAILDLYDQGRAGELPGQPSG